MSAATDGGPAFPQHVAPAYRQEREAWGMTLRDWFAGQIVASFAINAEREGWTAVECAQDAYAYADAMIYARGKSE